LISQLATGLATTTTNKPPSAEKLFVSRRNSSDSKRDSFLSNTGGTANIARLSNSHLWKQITATDLPVTATQRTAKEETKWRIDHQLREKEVGV
jgi:hypothetical protein